MPTSILVKWPSQPLPLAPILSGMGGPLQDMGSTQTLVIHKAGYCAIGLSPDKLPNQRDEPAYNILSWPVPFKNFSFCYEWNPRPTLKKLGLRFVGCKRPIGIKYRFAIGLHARALLEARLALCRRSIQPAF
jgi:hypothetical protein